MKDNGIPPDQLKDGKHRVLVVDDDPEIVELFVDVLERDGRFEVKTASTGYDAGMLTHEFHPDLIILDYMLPDINGNVVCRTIRSKQEFVETKIIIVQVWSTRKRLTNSKPPGRMISSKSPLTSKN
ncbi:MAG: response regulator [Phycisphaerae bacterium]|nr:MAG: response regulator [Phycisphaerae bacterium]